MDLNDFDFSGWATKANVKCSDGRTIMPDAFKHMDGKTVPLVWGHRHDDPNRVLGQMYLQHRDEGMYGYGKFNDTDNGKTAKKLVECGNVNALSIYANRLKEKLGHVMHGEIREVSLVLAGANPEAYIENIIAHGEMYDDEVYIFPGDNISLSHSDEDEFEDDFEEGTPDDQSEELQHEDKEEKKMADNANSDKTVKDVVDSMTEEQKTVMYAIIGKVMEDQGADDEDDEDEVEHSEGGNNFMKMNVFDQEDVKQTNTLSHADQEAIIELAKKPGVGTLKQAMEIFAEDNAALAHGIFENYEELFPEYELLKKGEPETLERDQSWIGYVMGKIHKSPISRIRTRNADARVAELKAKGYQNKGDKKTEMAKIQMIGRTTDPQTIYIKDDMHRDDIIDVTDFDVVNYQWKMMRHILDETLALAALVGDGRDLDDPDKIKEQHIRSVWHDTEMYTLRADVDIAAARAELQGTDTNAHFGENYIYAEAIIAAALYSREKYKGSGNLDFYCTPHLVNVMLLARDLNGRRIYDSVSDLARALNVNAIHTVEQFEGLTRVDETSGKTKKLLGLFVNMSDYQFGSTKGGQITRFDDFDMDFNKYKYMLETRLSGSLTKLFSAIALEEPVETVSEDDADESTQG